MENGKPLADRWLDLSLSLERSIRYHACREDHFGRLHRATAWAGIFFGTATFAALSAELPKGAILAAIISSAMSCFDLVVGFSAKENAHKNLKSKFGDLVADMQCSPDEARLEKISRKRVLVEKDEFPAVRVLDLHCHNALVRARGEGTLWHVPFWARWTCDYISWESVANGNLKSIKISRSKVVDANPAPPVALPPVPAAPAAPTPQQPASEILTKLD